MRSGFINVAGIYLEFAEQGSGEPLLMLHGAGGLDRAHPVNAVLVLSAPAPPEHGEKALPA